MSIALVIPAYNPPQALVQLVRQIISAKPEQAVIVVNDGSSPEFEECFSELASLPKVICVGHSENRGKGDALKTAFKLILENMPNIESVVTADADGQHRVEDVLKLIELKEFEGNELILGVRSFGKKTPVRSLVGNKLTSFVMYLATGHFLSDTQTGLRRIPKKLFLPLLNSKSAGYEFEMDMLFIAKESGSRFRSIPIETVYLKGNPTSHFNPFWDSLKIYFCFIRFSLSSLVASIIDTTVFMLVFPFTQSIVISLAVARVLAGLFNFQVNRKMVFFHKEHYGKSLLYYFLLVVTLATFAFGLIECFHHYMKVHLLTAKIVSESLVFLLSFTVQKLLIFKGHREINSSFQ